jgi:hypothetical protein
MARSTDHIEPALGHCLQHLVEGGSLIAPLGPGDAGVLVDLEDAPAGTLDHGPEFQALVLGRLIVGADPEIQGRSLNLHDPNSGYRQ